ncbi:hypothetical protein PRK78_007134 [Emydomyces testavorans]|uniref:Uncharacterized protein n=1 Tax=Emydomyces testavorans TaxID=2070801 RepID=A0AAF0DNT9_9EURO|nr:hypothetical protein PRK78_007134 [Emydomyces testavorans]
MQHRGLDLLGADYDLLLDGLDEEDFALSEGEGTGALGDIMGMRMGRRGGMRGLGMGDMDDYDEDEEHLMDLLRGGPRGLGGHRGALGGWGHLEDDGDEEGMRGLGGMAGMAGMAGMGGLGRGREPRGRRRRSGHGDREDHGVDLDIRKFSDCCGALRRDVREFWADTLGPQRYIPMEEGARIFANFTVNGVDLGLSRIYQSYSSEPRKCMKKMWRVVQSYATEISHRGPEGGPWGGNGGHLGGQRQLHPALGGRSFSAAPSHNRRPHLMPGDLDLMIPISGDHPGLGPSGGNHFGF